MDISLEHRDSCRDEEKNNYFYLKNSKDNEDTISEELSYLRQCIMMTFSCLFQLYFFSSKISEDILWRLIFLSLLLVYGNQCHVYIHGETH